MARDSSEGRKIRSFFETNAPAIIFLLVVLVAWQIVTTTLEIPSWFIPSPLVIIDAFQTTLPVNLSSAASIAASPPGVQINRSLSINGDSL